MKIVGYSIENKTQLSYNEAGKGKSVGSAADTGEMEWTEREKLKMRQKRQKAVAFYKGIAILWIVICHSAQRYRLPFWARVIPQYGQMGCQVFLVLSAYTLSISMMEHHWGYAQYLKRRLKRIAPGYWLALLIYFVLGKALELPNGANLLGISTSAAGIAINACLLHGLVPTKANSRIVRGGWFVGTIFLFYLIFPALYKGYFGMKRHRRLTVPLVLQAFSVLITAMIERSTSLRLTNNAYLYFYLINQLPCLSLGLVMADLYREDELHLGANHAWLAWSVLFVSIALFFSGIRHAFAIIPTLAGLAFLLFFAGSREKLERANSWIVEIICEMGNISYTLYLFHFFVVYEGAIVLKKSFGFLGMNDGIVMYSVSFPFLMAGAVLTGYFSSVAVDRITDKLFR